MGNPWVERVGGSRAVALVLALGPMAALAAEQLRRIFRAREYGRRAIPARAAAPAQPGAVRWVLVVGDSTGAGVGGATSADSIAGRMAKDFAQAEVRNDSVSGATVAEVAARLRELPAERRFDLVLVFAGGNDVLRRTPQGTLRRAVRELLEAACGRSARVLWVGMANVGLAPAFLPPLSWWLTWRTRRVTRLLADEATRYGAQFVDFFHERHIDPFSADPDCYYSVDGVHPSADAYEYCYRRMKPLISEALGLPTDARHATPQAACAARSGEATCPVP